MIFTKCGEWHFVVVLRLNLNLLRTLSTDERSEILLDLTGIMNETKVTLIVKYF
jgi:hypothetical protein